VRKNSVVGLLVRSKVESMGKAIEVAPALRLQTRVTRRRGVLIDSSSF
jgi:hypothetical protein